MRIDQAEAISNGEFWTVTLWTDGPTGRNVVRVQFDADPDDTEESAEDVARALWRDCPYRFELVKAAPSSI